MFIDTKEYIKFAEQLKEKESKRESGLSRIEVLLALGFIEEKASIKRIANLTGYSREIIKPTLKILNRLGLVSGNSRYYLTNKGNEVYTAVVIWG